MFEDVDAMQVDAPLASVTFRSFRSLSQDLHDMVHETLNSAYQRKLEEVCHDVYGVIVPPNHPNTTQRPPISTTRCPITDFPLPPELRDFIYGYLLDPVHIQYTPKCSPDGKDCDHPEDYHKWGRITHSYKFHTNILAVNKTIGQQAKKYLYEHATFLQLTYQCRGFSKLLHLMDVPFVSEDEKTIHASGPLSFVMDIDWPLHYPFVHSPTNDYGKAKGKAIFLSRDFHHLHRMLRLLLTTMVPWAVHLATGFQPFVYSTKIPMPFFKLFAPLELELSKVFNTGHFFHSIAGLTGAGYNIRFEGFAPISNTSKQRLKQSLAPSIVCWQAWSWERFELLLEIKRRTDELARSGQDDAALRRYNWLLAWSSTTVETFDPVLQSLEKRRLLLRFDIKLFCAWITARQDTYSYHPDIISDLIDTVFPIHEIREARILLADRISDIYEAIWMSKGCKDGLKITSLRALVLFLHTMGSTGVDPRDISEIERTRVLGCAEDAFIGKDWDRTAMLDRYKKTDLTFDHQQSCGLPARLEGLVGWQNVEYLGRLTKAEEEAIAAEQLKLEEEYRA